MTFVHRSWRLALVLGLLALAGALAVPAIAKNADVSIVGTSFQPATITVQAGDTVKWTTTQSIGQQHSVTSGKPGDSDAGSKFDSKIGLQDNGQSFEFTFANPGTYDYFCQVHPTQMTGQVVVTAAGASSPPATTGVATSAPPSGTPSSSAPASPGASQAPVPVEAGETVPPERKLITAGILVVALVLLFAASWYWRRLNPA